MTMKGTPEDPKGLIAEAYRIEAISDAECRSIFLDWALGLPPGLDQAAALRVLAARGTAEAPEHPMTAVLCAGLQQTDAPRRRGGWRSRPRG